MNDAGRGMVVAVLGAGRWGLTLAEVAARRGSRVRVWVDDAARAAALTRDRADPAALAEVAALHEAITIVEELGAAVAGADLVVLAVRVADVRAVMRALGAAADPSCNIVIALRGLEPESLERPSRILRQETALRKVGVVAGPALVPELLAGQPNALVLASHFPEVGEAMVHAFASDALRIYLSRDVVGVEVATAAATVGAVAVGVALELGLGPATLATLLTRSAAEMARVVVAAGGSAQTAWGLAGLGELLALRESGSREVAIGRRLAQGASLARASEGLGPIDAIEAGRSFVALAETLGVETTIASVMARILDGRLVARDGMAELMRLGPMVE